MTLLSPLLIEDTVRAALLEDLGHGRDITAAYVIPPGTEARAVITAREDGILAGLIPALSAFALTDSDFDIEVFKQDGDQIAPGDPVATIEGPAQAMMSAERTALNFLTHLSGIATLTARYVAAVADTDAAITCTRKTLPGFRIFQKYAVAAGGGVNHRMGLDDAILIKDNHIAAAGGIEAALDGALRGAGHMVKIGIEVDTPEQLAQVLAHGGAHSVLLDNFSLADLETAVQMIGRRLISEASGGITLATVEDVAKTGVDYISIGALTQSAAALDLALDLAINQDEAESKDEDTAESEDEGEG